MYQKTNPLFMALNNALSWYQKKVGAYDKQLWERTVESRVLRGLSNLPKKNAKLKTELIDVDLVRGSAFPKAKPEHGLVGATVKGFTRSIFLPVFYRWWIKRTSIPLFIFIFLLYLLQIGLVTVYYMHPTDFSDIQQAEVLIPVYLMIILGILNSQIVSTHHYSKISNKLSCVTKKKKIRRKSRPKLQCQPHVEESKSSQETTSEDRVNRNIWKKSSKNGDKGSFSGSDIPSSSDNEERVNPLEPENVIQNKSEENSKMILHESGYSSRDKFSSKSLDLSSDIQSQSLLAQTDDEKGCMIQDNYDDSIDLKTVKDDVKQPARRRIHKCSNLKFPGRVDTQHRINSSCESDMDNLSPTIKFQATLSEIDWATSNPDCNSDTSDSSSVITNGSSVHDQDIGKLDDCENLFAWDNPETPNISVITSTHTTASDKVSCTIWDFSDYKKVDLTVLDISSSIIRKVDMTPESTDYFKAGMAFCLILCVIPCLHRLNDTTKFSKVSLDLTMLTVPSTDMVTDVIIRINDVALGVTIPKRLLILSLMLQRLALSGLVFFLLKRGPQRSVDVIVSSSFLLTLSSASFLCVQLLKDGELFANVLYHWELTAWTCFLGVFLLRFITLGSKINHKYRNLSVLITEQINLYLHMEQKPHKKEELMLAHSVLKLAAELLKELESPFKISGLSANSYLHNFTKIVVLSAFSAVLTEVLGFRLKLSKLAMFKL
ncbi:putative homeodomain transcription factor 2 [Nymphon striatum]|nr:putative homeodomain transcription factor 2 [Nymphon striatum]